MIQLSPRVLLPAGVGAAILITTAISKGPLSSEAAAWAQAIGAVAAIAAAAALQDRDRRARREEAREREAAIVKQRECVLVNLIDQSIGAVSFLKDRQTEVLTPHQLRHHDDEVEATLSAVDRFDPMALGERFSTMLELQRVLRTVRRRLRRAQEELEDGAPRRKLDVASQLAQLKVLRAKVGKDEALIGQTDPVASAPTINPVAQLHDAVRRRLADTQAPRTATVRGR